MTTNLRPELQRLRYRQGQMLGSRDFRDQLAIDAERRWWHNRAIHAAVGVAVGMDVQFVGNQVKDLLLNVGPGIANDCYGREIVHLHTTKIPYPVDLIRDQVNARIAAATSSGNALVRLRAPSMVNYPQLPIVINPDPTSPVIIEQVLAEALLVIRPRASHGCDQDSDVMGACVPALASDCVEPVVFDWVDPRSTHYRPGNENIVASIELILAMVHNTLSVLPVKIKRISRPFGRPHVASGATIAGRTNWTVWEQPVGTELGFQIKIDTSAAGFTEVPHYFAWLQGSLLDPPDTDFFPIFYEHIDQQSSEAGFVFHLFMPELILPDGSVANHDFPNHFQGFAQQHNLYVAWLGIQPGHSPFDIPVSAGGMSLCEVI